MAEPGDGGRRRVVVAEDDHAMRELLVEVLRDGGFDVLEARNGRELFWSVESARGGIAVIVTDVRMPAYDGLEVAEAWAHDGSRPPMILMSAFPDETAKARAARDRRAAPPEALRARRPRAARAPARGSGVAVSLDLTRLRWPSLLLLWLLVAAGDLVTTAETAFTLLYLAPVGLAVWNLGAPAGVAVAVLSTASSFATWMTSGALSPPVLVWNLVCELGVFLAFALVLERLRRRVEVEARGRASAVEQLRHADRLGTVGKLAAGVAHELGTPLNVVGARARLLSERPASPDDVTRSAGVIVDQAERMSEIIKGLLAFSRRGATSKAATDLGRLVRETSELLGVTARARGVELALRDVRPAVASVNANEIQQVLGNLVVNAVQAMPHGGHVWLSATPEDGAAGPLVRLRVEDDGPGIPPEVLPHVFDPFFTTKDVGEGTGLGLAVAFGIVQDHGGHFEVGTAVGKGTRFDVCLPRGGQAPVAS